MSQVLVKKFAICNKALNNLCNEYDGFEPLDKCLYNNGLSCQQNKPKKCSRCGNNHKAKCDLSLTNNPLVCPQSINKKLLYRSGFK